MIFLLACVDVILTTATYGAEISWSLGSGENGCSSNGQSYDNNEEYIKTCCFAAGTYTLNCTDSYGDGWHGGFIEVEGIGFITMPRYCIDFHDGDYETAQVTIRGTVNKFQVYIKVRLNSINVLYTI